MAEDLKWGYDLRFIGISMVHFLARCSVGGKGGDWSWGCFESCERGFHVREVA